jgi:cytochrome c-type biogenesis protein CcmH
VIRRTLLAGIVAASLAMLSSASVAAQPAQPVPQRAPAGPVDSVLEARTTEVARDLRCPVCQGLSIQDSPSELSQQMRALVKEQLASGKTPDGVRAYFISKYGEWILLAPKPQGFNLVAYLAPALLFLGGLAGIALVVRRWTAPLAEAPALDQSARPPED